MEPFVFYTERRLVVLTGLSAKNLAELLSNLEQVPGSSIFYHTHHQYLALHFEKPLFYNDFAVWVSEALQEEALAEKLAIIDLLSFVSIRDLRDAIIATIARYLDGNGRRLRECPPGEKFHFCKSKSFMMPTGMVAEDRPDLFGKLPRVSNVSLFFHFFEARLRLGRPTNDFSEWLDDRGEPALASAINRLDPYSLTLDELRDRIVDLGRR